MGALSIVQSGVLTGSEAMKLYSYARSEGFALPAVNVVGTDSANAVLEAAKRVNSPVIVQLSNGGASFWAGFLGVQGVWVLTGVGGVAW